MTNLDTEAQYQPEHQRKTSKLEQLRDRPDLYMRDVDMFPHGTAYPEKPLEAIHIRNEELDVLRRLGINVPRLEYGEVRPGKPLRATEATERIFGDNLMEGLINNDPAITNEALEHHYTSLLNYLKLVHRRGGYFMSDITRSNDGQYMFGHTAQDPEPKIYLSDQEPILGMYHPGEPDHPDNNYFYHSFNLLEGTVKQAQLFGRPMDHILDAISQYRAEIGAPSRDQIRW